MGDIRQASVLQEPQVEAQTTSITGGQKWVVIVVVSFSSQFDLIQNHREESLTEGLTGSGSRVATSVGGCLDYVNQWGKTQLGNKKHYYLDLGSE